MPHYCCITDCYNNSDKPECKNLRFYIMPKGKTPIEKKRRHDWLKAIKRKDFDRKTDQQINNFRVCSAHFVSGARCTYTDNIDWVPTIFTHKAAVPVKEVTQVNILDECMTVICALVNLNKSVVPK